MTDIYPPDALRSTVPSLEMGREALLATAAEMIVCVDPVSGTQETQIPPERSPPLESQTFIDGVGILRATAVVAFEVASAQP